MMKDTRSFRHGGQPTEVDRRISQLQLVISLWKLLTIMVAIILWISMYGLSYKLVPMSTTVDLCMYVNVNIVISVYFVNNLLM